MTAKRLFITASCLFLLATIGLAQEIEVSPPRNDVHRTIGELWVSYGTRAVFEEDPVGAFMLFLAMEGGSMIPGLKEEIGITDEQKTHLREVMDSLKPEGFDEFQSMMRVVEEKILEDLNYNLNEEEDEALVSFYRYAFEAANTSATAALTDEQIQKMDGMMLALTGGLESPFFNERHMAAIDMTDAQREQFKQIDAETKPGRDRLIAAISEETLKMIDTGKMDFKSLLSTFAQFREYQTDLRDRRRAVLTQAQIARAASLSRLPKFMSPFNLLQQWVPGPNSWQPGDAVPEGFQLERNPRIRQFPRGE